MLQSTTLISDAKRYKRHVRSGSWSTSIPSIHGNSLYRPDTVWLGVTFLKPLAVHGCTILIFWVSEGFINVSTNSVTLFFPFYFIAGYDLQYLQRTKASPIELARKRFPRPSQPELIEALSSSVSFLIVREPFERLLSAYRNKLEGCRNKYYKLLGEQIVRKFRRDKNNKPINNKRAHKLSKVRKRKLFGCTKVINDSLFAALWTNI